MYLSKTKYGVIPKNATVCPDGTVKLKKRGDAEVLVGKALPCLSTVWGFPAMEVLAEFQNKKTGLHGYTTEDIFDLYLDPKHDREGVRIGYYHTVRGIAEKLDLHPLLVDCFGMEAAKAILDLAIRCLLAENLFNSASNADPPKFLTNDQLYVMQDRAMHGQLRFSHENHDAAWYERFLSGALEDVKITEEGIQRFFQVWTERARQAHLDIPDSKGDVEGFTKQNLLACVQLMGGELLMALRREAPLGDCPSRTTICRVPSTRMRCGTRSLRPSGTRGFPSAASSLTCPPPRSTCPICAKTARWSML